ncbi:MAG: DUF4160 domain-containing protein [Candidatus Sericytochromatia bacterium]|nr:DUF4160 domain-containing protein [Candidatus Tanganyikabacteria bacterium]
MPELSRFYGIVIRMFYDDHGTPHFHAAYGGQTAAFRIDPPGLLVGRLPPRALGLVVEWAGLHRDELLGAWEAAKFGQTPSPIDPLP